MHKKKAVVEAAQAKTVVNIPVAEPVAEVMDVDFQQAVHPTEVTLNSELEDTIIHRIVHGPDVSALFTLLKMAPQTTDAGAEADLLKK